MLDANAQQMPGLRASVVVALVDSGIQPYHDVFRAPPEWIHPSIPNAITLGIDFRDRVLNDVRAWNELKQDQLYYFEGTRVFAISKAPTSILDDNPNLIYDDVGTNGHGTGTASIVAQTAAHATIVMVETQKSPAQGIAWVANQSWIDVVSMSVSAVFNTPSDPRVHPDPQAENHRRIVDSGRIVINSAGNEPGPTIMGDGGPPWVISVGGAEQKSQGETVSAAKLPDVVANFTSDRIAGKADLHAYRLGSGTSYGAPMVAGVLAETILQLRVKFGDVGEHGPNTPLVNGATHKITNHEIRAAMNSSAVYWDAGNYAPTENPYPVTDPYAKIVTTTAPILPAVDGTPVGPWVQMGWGYVGPELVPQLVGVLSASVPPPTKPTAAVQYMEQVWAAKAAYWDAWQGL